MGKELESKIVKNKWAQSCPSRRILREKHHPTYISHQNVMFVIKDL